MSKIKVALCLSGEPRSSMFCFPYIYESLINLGPLYEVDVYIHSWKEFRALPLYKPKDYEINWINEEDFYRKTLTQLKNNFDQNSSNVNLELNYILQNTLNVGTLKNSLLMYLSMQKCFNLIKKPYDAYIRGRFDLYFPNKSYIQNLIKEVKNKKSDIILDKLEVYDERNRTLPTIIDDKFAICNLEGAKYYFNIYNDIFNIISESDILNPHVFLKNYLDKSKLNVNTLSFGFNYDLVRSTRIMTYHKTPYFDN
jgi:hypothetical protein